PEHTLLDVASMMCDHKVGSAIVHTDEGYPGIITERDLLRAIARGADLSKARVEEFMTSTPVTASRHWDVANAG
ncbi:MAG: CBS domain-containing protein, partial [Actinomycetota bacterium]